MRNIVIVFLITLNLVSSLSAQDNLNITKVGSLYDSLWITCQDIAVKDHYAYLISLNTVLVLDVNDPNQIEHIGTGHIQISLPIDRAQISGDLLIAGWLPCCQVVDISDPTNPTEVSAINGVRGSQFVLENNILYISSWRSHLNIFDLTNAHDPAILCSLNVEEFRGDFDAIKVLGWNNNILFMGDIQANIIALIDVSDPESPHVTAVTEIETDDDFIAFYDDYAYTNEGSIVDFSNLDSVFVAGNFEGQINHRVHVHEQTLFLGKNTYNLADPLNPESINTEESYIVHDRFAWQDDRLYHLRPEGLRVYDIAEPQQPELIGRLEDPFGSLGKLVVDGDYAYILDSGKLRVANIADPENPYEIAVLLDMQYLFPNYDQIKKHEDFCYLYNQYGILVISVADPEVPEVVTYYKNDSDLEIRDVAFKEDFLFMAFYDSHNNGHLTVYDASDPANLDSIHSYNVNASYLCFVDDYLYMDDYRREGRSRYLKWLNVSDPFEAEFGDSVVLYSEISKFVNYDNTLAYLAGATFFSLDISNRESPRIAEFLTYFDAEAIHIHQNIAFLTGNNLYGIDISDPYHPQIIGEQDGTVRAIAGQNHNLYMIEFQRITYNYGLSIYDASEILSVSSSISPHPSSLTLFPAYPNPFNSHVTIPYRVGSNFNSTIQVSIFDDSGRLVDRLHPGYSTAGLHSLIWNATGLPTGVYIVKLNSKNISTANKVLLMR